MKYKNAKVYSEIGIGFRKQISPQYKDRKNKYFPVKPKGSQDIIKVNM